MRPVRGARAALFRALLRLTEFDGEILIDGVAASRAPLRALRGALALVQQDPMLFSGSVRHNVDPTGARATLKRARLVDARAGALGLDAPVDEGGANFSAGERQLLCVARALLVRPRILLLDEATSMLDRATDEAVQRALPRLGARRPSRSRAGSRRSPTPTSSSCSTRAASPSGPPRELLARDAHTPRSCAGTRPRPRPPTSPRRQNAARRCSGRGVE